MPGTLLARRFENAILQIAIEECRAENRQSRAPGRQALGRWLEKLDATSVSGGKADPKVTDAFEAMVPELIATAACLAPSDEDS